MNFARLRNARGKSFLLIILNLPTVLFFLVILLDLLLLLLFLLVFRLLTRLARVFLSFLLLFLLIRSFGVACRTTETNARQSLKSESETKTRKRRERVERTESNSIRSVHVTSRRTNERTNERTRHRTRHRRLWLLQVWENIRSPRRHRPHVLLREIQNRPLFILRLRFRRVTERHRRPSSSRTDRQDCRLRKPQPSSGSAHHLIASGSRNFASSRRRHRRHRRRRHHRHRHRRRDRRRVVVGFVGGVEYCRRGSVSQSSPSLEREKSARTSNDVSTLFDERTNASNERARLERRYPWRKWAKVTRDGS